MVSKPFSISRMPHLLRRWKTSGLRAKVSILTPSQKQEFMVVALEPVSLVFQPKIDACHGFLLVSDISVLLETDRELTWKELL